MGLLSQEGKVDSQLRQLAIQLTRLAASKDYWSEIALIYYYVRDDIRYVRDVDDVETLQQAVVTASQAAGDCDDKCILLASMLMSIGHRVRFVAAAYDGPGMFEHVYLEVLCDGQWVGLDTTEPVEPGLVPAGEIDRMVYHC